LALVVSSQPTRTEDSLAMSELGLLRDVVLEPLHHLDEDVESAVVAN